MNKRTARTAALLLAGTTLLAPTAAGADPVINASSVGEPTFDGTSGTLGQAIQVAGSGCTPGSPSYMGQFVAQDADPFVTPGWLAYQTETDAGSFTWDVNIPLDHAVGDFTVRWYCSTAPVTAIDDPSIQWVAPPMTMTITDPGAGSNAMTSGQEGGVTFTTDPEGLPAIDEMGITGENAAKLKAVVDARAEQLGRVQRMYAVFFGRQADHQGLDFWMRHIGRTWSVEEAAQRMSRSSEFQRGYGRLGDDEFVHQLYRNTLSRDADRNGADFWANRLGRRSDRAEIALAFADSAEFTRRTEAANYVATAFLATTGRVGSPRAMAPFVEQVEDGAYKVQVIEDIALTARPASWWNRVLG
ncbi:MAG: DUF4214 domain-containing protein [Acidimicrobiales bacterium]|nr:DUF4214 domain-containing protein [Acidimicrobiales bacterium]